MAKKKLEVKNISANRKSLIINSKSSFNVVEAYKATRTNLMFALSSKQLKNVVVFTSFSPMDGKTTTCINLGITFAQTGAKVLIIDADLRKPTTHKYLNTPAKPGLSDKLGGFYEDEVCIYKTETDNLFVMPAGTLPPNPTELLISDNMDKLLEAVSPLFDYIFIDSPPIGLVTDAAVLGLKCQGVINVVHAFKSRKEDIHTVANTLEQAGAKLIGVVLNAVDTLGNGYRYRYSRSSSKYGYYRDKYTGNANKYGYTYGLNYGMNLNNINNNNNKPKS